MNWKLYLFFVPFLFINCVKEQQKVSWLKIEKWDLIENPNSVNETGELTHNFNQVFLNMNGKILGAFQLPIKIPILAEGLNDFVLIPGIVVNGINATKFRYPFVDPYRVQFELKLEDTVTMQPFTYYYNDIQFLIEDFESPALSIENEGAAQLVRDNNPEFLKWGNFYGRADLNSQDSLLAAYTTFGVNLPKQGQPVFLELDVMNTNSLVTSLVSVNPSSIFDDINIQVNPQDKPHWRKIYIDLTELVSTRFQATLNEQAFRAFLDVPNTERFIGLDNIKVVYR